jgi:hypothetical protein
MLLKVTVSLSDFSTQGRFEAQKHCGQNITEEVVCHLKPMAETILNLEKVQS